MTSTDFNLEDIGILVTGASGFLGLHLVHELLACNAFVVGMSRHSPFANDENEGNFRALRGDITQKEDIEQAISLLIGCQRKKTAVIHLAAMADVRACKNNPVDAQKTNVTGTRHLLEQCAHHGITHVLYPSTAYVYGDHVEGKADETHPCHPASIYAQTKLAGEAVLQKYGSDMGLSCDIFRPSNMYGPGLSAETVMVQAIQRGLSEGEVYVRDFSPTRDFIYVSDVVQAFILALLNNNDTGTRIYNLGSGQGTSIGQLAALIAELTLGTREASETHGKNTKTALVLDNSKIKEDLLWDQKIKLKQGLQKCISALQVKGQKNEK